ncbi:MAG: TetR/AcrR family transcriptional regulator [Ignavibacteriae bacterium]|nr:TetR/AcrR family transcriptional regulator [Ignavibacteriota bacterium]
MRTKNENKAAAIRENAMKMIVAEGFDGFSMQKLAKSANVSPATLYIYYKNKEDLLNQLFNEVQQTFADVALEGFNPQLSFEEGLWIQWKNRLKFVLEYPVHFSFYEQFRNSPLINSSGIHLSSFKENMKQFVINAIQKGELKMMAPEIFWSVAYGSFYSLVKFHLQEKTMMGNDFKLNEVTLKTTFDIIVKALKP